MSPPPALPGFDWLALGDDQPRMTARLEQWRRDDLGRRIWAKDHTVWSPEPVAELGDRLGWLDLPATPSKAIDQQLAFADEIVAGGFDLVVLLGMGGSSLAPEVFQATFGNAARHPRLLVLDSTHPAAVAAVDAAVQPARTLFVVSSKSGTTLESSSFFRYFWARVRETSTEPGRHFVAITDPGTPLETLGRERRMRRVFPAPPNVGGRYSALSVFGTVPAALIGADVHRLLQRARIMAAAAAPGVEEESNPALALGAVLGEMARAGRDKVTFVPSPRLASFPAWLEQLIAESTGKNGQGIVPVAGEALAHPSAYGRDRLFVSMRVDGDDAGAEPLEALVNAGVPALGLRLADCYDLGQEIFRWEMATAAAGAILGIQPFDQPDVQLAKDLTRQAMATTGTPSDDGRHAALPDVQAGAGDLLARAVTALFLTAREGDYVALQAYLEPSTRMSRALASLQALLRDQTKLATTCGFGPRFLHSTGQLHKGGPDTGIFLQLVDEPSRDLAVPETEFTFRALVRAQALGDGLALVQRGRRFLRVNLGKRAEAGLERLAKVCAKL